MKRFLACLVCIFSIVSEVFAKDQTIVIHQIRGGLDYKSELTVEGPQTKTTEFELKGYYDNWKCEAWSWDDKHEVLLTCHSPYEQSAWKLQSSIYCDSKDSFFIDAVTIKCKGKKAIKLGGGGGTKGMRLRRLANHCNRPQLGFMPFGVQPCCLQRCGG